MSPLADKTYQQVDWRASMEVKKNLTTGALRNAGFRRRETLPDAITLTQGRECHCQSWVRGRLASPERKSFDDGPARPPTSQTYRVAPEDATP